MKIKFLSGPRAGQTSHVPNSQEYQVMASAGLIEIVPMAPRGTSQWLEDMKERSAAFTPPLADAQVTWLVAKGALTERYGITARCSRANCSSFFFDGHPDAWRDGHYLLEHLEFVHSCGGGAPVQVPASICNEYRRVKSTENGGTMSADVANYHRNCQKSKGDGERVDLFNPRKENVGDGVEVVLPPIVGPRTGVADPRHNNYGSGNFQPSPGDGQPADLSKLSPVFSKK
jgi:hypothetical protein